MNYRQKSDFLILESYPDTEKFTAILANFIYFFRLVHYLLKIQYASRGKCVSILLYTEIDQRNDPNS